jgi:ubiquinol-cytochrome c reductase cytochrome b subunit
MADQLTGYYAPKNFNVWYFFGSLALLVFVMQIVTGIFITMHFKPGEPPRSTRSSTCRREVPYGWLLQYMHAVGASFFFIVVYLHMARAFLYGSYKARANCCGSSAC